MWVRKKVAYDDKMMKEEEERLGAGCEKVIAGQSGETACAQEIHWLR